MTDLMNQSITLKSLTSFVAAVLLAFPASASAAEPKGNPANPDFTQGDAIPAGAKHDWNLGPTGLRGWMFCDQMVTTDARQIAITQVEKGSPADGVFLVGDVILGVGGKPFSYPAVVFEFPPRSPSSNYTYFFPITQEMHGRNIEVVVLGLAGCDPALNPEVWTTTYPHPYKSLEMLLE